MLRTFSMATLVVNLLAFVALLLFGDTIMGLFPSYLNSAVYTEYALYAPLLAQAIAMFVGLQVALFVNLSKKKNPTAAADAPTEKTRTARLWAWYPICTLVVLAVSAGVHGFFLRTAVYQMGTPFPETITIALMQLGLTAAAILMALWVAMVGAQWSRSKGIALLLVIGALLTLGAVAGVTYWLYDWSKVLEYKNTNDDQQRMSDNFDPSMLMRDEYRNPSSTSEEYGEEEEEGEEYSEGDDEPGTVEPEYDYIYVDQEPLAAEDAAKTTEAKRILLPENVAERTSAGHYLLSPLAEDLLNPNEDLYHAIERVAWFSFNPGHLGYKNNTARKEEKAYDCLFMYFVYHPSAILPALKQNQALILELLPKSRYQESNIPLVLDLLAESHAQLYQHNSDPNATLTYLYRLMLRQDKNGQAILVSHHYADMFDYMNTEGDAGNTLYELYSDDPLYYRAVMVWSYSFWARRHHQGNEQVAWDAIKTLQAMYK